MTTTSPRTTPASPTPSGAPSTVDQQVDEQVGETRHSTEHVDLLIIGAGLSGIGAAVTLGERFPDRSMAILEARERLGGTWDLFRYPGVRSDSDMLTLGYSFRPWTERSALASGPEILDYVRDTARERGVDRLIRYRHRALAADFDSGTGRWTVTVDRDGRTTTMTAGFLYVCAGYYRYDAGYTPDFPGVEDFTGHLVHPQQWPEDLDVAGRRIVVIGSGATAVTLVPALAQLGAHVTMLQRTPTWIFSLPSTDRTAIKLRRRLPGPVVEPVLRWRNVLIQMASYQLSRRRPELMKSKLLTALTRKLPQDYDVNTHFLPPYNPWDQRLCAVPDGDLFRTIRDGKAEVVTDTIDRFTADGVHLASGRTLPADLIVTATGLRLQLLGGMRLAVDGEVVDPAERLTYQGAMLDGVPNLALAIGYTNASWTLKIDLVNRFLVRVLTRMQRRGADVVTAVAPDVPAGERRPLLDLNSGYINRSLDVLPRQGPRAPWRINQNYLLDLAMFRWGRIAGRGLRFSRSPGIPSRHPGTDRAAGPATEGGGPARDTTPAASEKVVA
ncbi:FAD-containing monooxygenase EthA [Tersicoccus phoenicis]|uniref:FAD-containing monooxygenase EthA n=1 Tax=Tersicoccus phoenicis TaxID=554083 RepID=A0A1R1LB50_9MICC|nr:NAD(P)/FAD-dependent oxidoreductase [Tersicoccus phoenicis]OMH24737.1 FAD-containing monooxygenase EthA [Tersicoccus phoenicis]